MDKGSKPNSAYFLREILDFVENRLHKIFCRATICFAIIAVLDVIDLFDYFYFWGLVSVVGGVLVVIALLTGVAILSTVGFSLLSIDALKSLINIIMWTKNEDIGICMLIDEASFVVWIISIIVSILWLVFYVLLLIASIKRTSAKTLGLIAAILLIACLVANIFNAKYYITTEISCFIYVDVSITTILVVLLKTASAIFLGLSYENVSKQIVHSKSDTVSSNIASTKGILEEKNVDKLMRLKTFLDEGVISQEEFDAKKKQLLDI